MVERVRILCTVYDPDTGEYRYDWKLIFEIIGGAAVLQQRGAVFPVRMARPAACTQALMQRPTASLRQHGLKAWRTVEGGFDTAFGSALNPLRHLGAIGFLAFWLLAASGVVLFIFFDTSVAGAWRSIEELVAPAAGPGPAAARPAPLRRRRAGAGDGPAPAARMAARPRARLSALPLADRRAADRLRLRRRDRRLLDQLGRTRPVLGHRQPGVVRRAAHDGGAAGAQLPRRRGGRATACSRSSSSCTSACRCCCCSGCGSTSSASRAPR